MNNKVTLRTFRLGSGNRISPIRARTWMITIKASTPHLPLAGFQNGRSQGRFRKRAAALSFVVSDVFRNSSLPFKCLSLRGLFGAARERPGLLTAEAAERHVRPPGTNPKV